MILGYRLEFDDGSFEEHVVCRGSEDQCRAAADLLSAVSYSGPKKVVRACTFTEADSPPTAVRALAGTDPAEEKEPK